MNNAGLVIVYALGGLGLVKRGSDGKPAITPLGIAAIVAVVGGALYLAHKKGVL